MQTGLNDHSNIAEQLLRIFEAFADEFAHRGIPTHLSAITREGKYLKGKRLGQHPERFIEEYLVWPVLSALGYEYWAQPYGYPKWDQSRPDFSVENFHDEPACMVVGEVKTPNKFEYAKTDIEEYLKRDLGEPTVGIATDGVEWQMFARPKKSPDPKPIEYVDLRQVFEQLPRRHEEDESYSTYSVREQMDGVAGLRREAVQSRAAMVFFELE